MKSMDLKSWMARNRATGQALVDQGISEATMFGCVGFHSLFSGWTQLWRVRKCLIKTIFNLWLCLGLFLVTRSGSPTDCSSRASLPESLPTPTTAMPMCASLAAHPKPIPLLAPVTMATCMSSPSSICRDPHVGRLQSARNGAQQLRALQQEVRIRLVAETHAAVNLDV